MRRRVVFSMVWMSLMAPFAGHAQPFGLGLLPTQQRIQSIGKQVDLGLFPAGMALSSDGRLVLASNNGFLLQSLTVVDTANLKPVNKQIGTLGNNVLFIGVALSPDGRTGYASGHTETPLQDVIHVVTIAPGPTMTFGDPILMPSGSFAAGLAMSPDGRHLYVAENLADKLAIIDTQTKAIVGEVPVGRQPWGVAVHPSLQQVYVTNRVDRTLSIIDIEHMTILATVPTGNGPNAVAVSPDGAKIFVANASSDDLTVLDVNAPDSGRQIVLSPFPLARPGSSPNALAFSPDGARLYVANAWDNDLAVVSPATESVEGLIPVGVYPSAVAVSPDNRKLYVTNMKGARTFPRTRRRQRLDYDVNIRLGGTYGVKGTLQVFPVPSDHMLDLLDRRTKSNNGFDTGIRPSNRPVSPAPCFPIPCAEGHQSTVIKHVVFIVRENKTYDQDLGDLTQGDGEPAYLLYGRNVTPNLHALVEDFVLMDRFFADSEKSEPGHAWTMGAIDSDYEEKTWTSATFGGRPNDIGVQDPSFPDALVFPVATPQGQFWFDNCFRNAVSFRNYGEFLRTDDAGVPIDYWVSNTDAAYHRFDLDYPDQRRVDEWLREFEQQKAMDTFPQFTYIALPNDHGKGAGIGVLDPRNFVADNDLATGRIVEAISNSAFWKETVIFLTEDDPQSGADHVDSHRTVGAVIGPYVRRHYVSHTRFDMASMHRTMELILGLPPMSQFDQMAIPMRELFIDTDEPDTTPYTALPANFPMQTIRANPNAELSARQNWSRPDRVPDAVLNKIVWEYLKGAGSQP